MHLGGKADRSRRSERIVDVLDAAAISEKTIIGTDLVLIVKFRPSVEEGHVVEVPALSDLFPTIFISTSQVNMKFSFASLVSFVVLTGTPAVDAACPEGNFEFTFDTDPRRGKTDKKCSMALLQARYKAICNEDTATVEANLGLDDAAVEQLCNTAYDNYNALPFGEISKYGDQFDNEFYAGGTHWNYEVEDQNGNNNLKNDAYRVKKTYGRRGMIELPLDINSFNPEGKSTCDLNAAYCCWVQDRQANDNNGNCKTPYPYGCIDKDPADNANLCYIDHNRSHGVQHVQSGLTVFGGPGQNENIEGSIHCHGFAWTNDDHHVANQYKGNNLFYVSMYDHMYARGYVRNVPGAPMCACAENMAVVTRADCTEIRAEEQFKFSWNATAPVGEQASVELVKVKQLHFNACQGVNADGTNRDNDLEAYYRKLSNNQLTPTPDDPAGATPDLNELQMSLVGKEEGKCNMAIAGFLDKKGIKVPGADN